MGQDTSSSEWLWYLGLFSAFYLAIKILIASLDVFRTYVWAQLIARLTDRKLPSKYGRWAVVTGSTDGIGKAYARELAKAGHDIILISRTMEKLQKVAAEIKKDFGVETEIIQADFSHGRSIYEGIRKQLEGKEIGILVNNVGTVVEGIMRKFEDVSEEEMWRLILVNIASVPAMTQLVLPAMISRRKGAIVNISSIAAIIPIPYIQTYSGTKAFVSFFTRAMQVEYRSSGVDIQLVQPGGVVTNMIKIDGKMPDESLFLPSPETYAANTLTTLGHTDVTSGYWSHATQAFLMEKLPRWLVIWMLEQQTGIPVTSAAKNKSE